METLVNTVPKYQTEPLSIEKRKLLDISYEQCRIKEFKPVHCPYCSRVIGYVPKDEDSYNYFLCHKCKAKMFVNGRYFKTSRRHTCRKVYLKRKYNID